MSCEEGHFVCDRCHAAPAESFIVEACLASRETDMLRMLRALRAHPSIAIHGPEHHALVPGIILAACRNAGAAIDDDAIRTAIRRGARLPGGSCGYGGVCGAAAGVGTAFAVALGASPTRGPLRGAAIRATARALEAIGSGDAPRCCQRDAFLALRVAADLAPGLLGVRPTADEPLVCTQVALNRECAGPACELHPETGRG